MFYVYVVLNKIIYLDLHVCLCILGSVSVYPRCSLHWWHSSSFEISSYSRIRNLAILANIVYHLW